MSNLLCRATVIALIGMCVPENVTADVLDYYGFENNLADSGSGGNTASVLAGTPVFSGSVPAAVIPRTGQSNTASLNLGTSSALVFNYPFPFNTLTNATLEFYVNPSSLASEQNIFWTTTGSGDRNRFNLGITPSGLVFFDYREESGALHGLGGTAPGAITPNQWNFVAIVKNGNSYSIYVNNLAPVVTGDPYPNRPTSTRWTMNGRASVEPLGCCQFSGLIDEVRLSDQALSPWQFLNSSLVPSSTALASAPSPALFGAPVTLTATVSPSAATGRVTFYDGTSVLGVRTLTSGTATLETRLLPAGDRSLWAYYGGDAVYAPSTSTASVQKVNTQPASSFPAAVNYGVGERPQSIAVGDFNGDGKADLAVANYNTNNVSVLRGNGNGTFQAAVNYTTGSGPLTVAVGDFNGDGQADLAVANYLSANVSVLRGNGNGTFQAALNYPAGSGPSTVAVGDFNGDGKADLVVTNYNSNNVSVLRGNGNGTFQASLNHPAGSMPNTLTIGDFNGDGKADLAVAHETSPNVSVLLGNGNGTFQAAVNYGVGESPHSVAVGDFNGDGKTDLAVANVSSDNVSVLLGNGNGTFQAAVNYAAGAGPVSVAIGDFNGDDKADLAVGHWRAAISNDVSVLVGNGNGTFQTAVNYPAGSNPRSVTIGDFDGDGRADLVVANAENNNVSLLLGTGVTTPLAAVSAASFTPSVPLAPGVIAAGYGTNLVSTIEVAPATGALPTVLAQTSVRVRDSAGVERTAPLWFVSPLQINFYIAEETALGQATVSVVRSARTIASGTLRIDRVAPGLFAANANGQGVAAALALFARGEGSQSWQYVFNTGCAVGTCQPVPLDLGAATDQVFLLLYGTGIRGRSSLAAVTAKIGGVDAPVEYAGPVSGMVGLDQVNLRVPRSLIGRGEVEVVLTVEGKTANTVTVNIK